MTHPHRIKVCILHGDPVAHAGLSAAIAQYEDFEVVIAVHGVLEGLKDPPADVVVADYAHGMTMAMRVRQRNDRTGAATVLIIGNSNREWEVRRAMEQGVNGYVRTGCTLDELAAGIRDVHRGVRHLSPQAAQRLADTLSGDALTRREEEVLHLLVKGLGNKLIARYLGIAEGTVKSHLRRVFDKLRVDSRTQAIRVAERRGLLGDAELTPREHGHAPRPRDPLAPGGTSPQHALHGHQANIPGP